MKRLPIVLLLLTLFTTTDARAQNAVAQFVHGSADPSLNLVDIHVDNLPLVQNFAFREATAYLEIPTEIAFTIDITLPGGDPVTESLYHFDGFSNAGLTFTIFLRGVADTTLFSANPDVNEFRSTSLQFRINPIARETPPGDPQLAWFNFYNGITDSPAFNIWASEDSTNLSTIGALHYSAFTGYTSANRGLMVFDRVDPGLTTVMESYAFDFSSIPNSTVTIFSTGFADPDVNQNGEGIAFHAALADGTVLPSSVVTDTENEIPFRSAKADFDVYPNPANRKVSFDMDQIDPNSVLELYDPLGRKVWSSTVSNSEAISVQHLPNGLYHAIIVGDEEVRHASFLVKR